LSRKRHRQDNPRLAALGLLSGVLDAKRNLADNELPPRMSDARDAAFARHLAYEVLRWLGALQWLAGQLLEKPLKKKDRDIARLILLGLVQLWRDEAASHAAVNETAKCARLLRKPWAVGLVNAVLRRFQREKNALLQSLERTAARFAHPQWMQDAIRSDWPDHWQEILHANNQHPPLWLRCNPRRTDVAAFRADLEAAGFAVEAHPHAAEALCIQPAAAVEKIPGFAEGLCSVQDPAAQLAKELLGPRAGERVLDACAAPGGKTAHLLESCPGIELTALDRHPQRAQMITQTLERLGLRCDVRVADAADTESWWDGQPFDRILLDAPCSATGVIRRHPEIKWLRTPGQVDVAVQLQAELLAATWPLLKPDGVLVYATCSVLKCENSHQLKRFLQQNGDAIEQMPAVEWGLAGPPGRQVLPGQAQMDGFFYAVLRKSA
jgi:16S rRNA (cytosine967-C5)-methyltransferase